MKEFNTELLKAEVADALKVQIDEILVHALKEPHKLEIAEEHGHIYEELGELIWNGVPMTCWIEIDVRRRRLHSFSGTLGRGDCAAVVAIVTSVFGPPNVKDGSEVGWLAWEAPGVVVHMRPEAPEGLSDFCVGYPVEGDGNDQGGGEHDPR